MPTDIKNLTLLLYKEWNPSTPVETFLSNIETQQVFATKSGHPFHTYLLIEAALSVIKDTRQFKDELREYARLHPDPTLVQWHQFKRFWIEKFAEYECDRATIHRTQQDLALQALLQEVSSLRQLINHNQASNIHQVPSNIQFPPAPPSMPAYRPLSPPLPYPIHPNPPPPPLIHHMPATPVHMPPPPPTLSTTQPYAAPPQHQHYNPQAYRGRNCSNHNSGGWGRGRNNTVMPGQRNNPPHPIKRYNNWWHGSSCGFDTPHDGNSCTRQAPRHLTHLTRDHKIADMHLPLEQQWYRNASHAGHHKRILPSQAVANGYPQYQRDS
eukprot:CCRYP_008526-RA/>CCRYP_008526-RA protein AED:0.71 eAED:0.41 QI:0/0/0/1/1/1/2/0/324